MRIARRVDNQGNPEKDCPRHLTFSRGQEMRQRIRSREGGFSLVEVLVTTGLLLFVSAMFLTIYPELIRITERESSRSVMISTIRSGLEIVTRSLRNEMVQFNVLAGTPLGVNLDLDVGGTPLVRDGLLFYVDRNGTALLYAADDTGQPVTAGLDDANADGNADVIGIGLTPQDDNRDGAQDFIDADGDGNPDDVDGDGVGDRLWHLTLVQFGRVNDVTDAALWRAGRVLSRNLYHRLLDPAGPLAGYNTDTFQFAAKSPSALLSDTNGDGVLDETEMGNIATADGIINAATEVSTLDEVEVTLHYADRVRFGGGTSLVREDLSYGIRPRAIALYRRNRIIGLVDVTDPKHIN